MKLILAKTGVKHLHHKAKDFDISIYFESNGHGTVYHNENTLEKIQNLKKESTEKDFEILEFVEIFLNSFNKTVGDSLSVLICVEKCLKILNLKCSSIYKLYEIIPAVNLKKKVQDKSIYESNEDDSRLIFPKNIQDLIDDIVKEYVEFRGRCFIRASGTEDIVRIYAEATTDEIAELIARKVYEIVE